MDVHELIEQAASENLKNIYFRLLPTWYFFEGLCAGGPAP
jgi:hypothetical protein